MTTKPNRTNRKMVINAYLAMLVGQVIVVFATLFATETLTPLFWRVHAIGFLLVFAVYGAVYWRARKLDHADISQIS